MAKRITPKQERFIQEYLIDLNGTQSAIRSGYSEKTANEQASRLLANVNIQEAIAKAQAKRSQRTEVTQDMVVDGLLKEAQFKDDGATHGARVSAWGLLGKHTGGFSDRHEYTGANGGPIIHTIERTIVKTKN